MRGHDQKPQEDTLVDRGLEDALDEGYSPPERQPASHRTGTTAEEQLEGDTLDQRLQQEEPEADPYAEPDAGDEDAPWSGDTPADARAGRLVAPDEGAHEDVESQLVAEDVGISGGAASAEEAAMHVIEPEP